MMRTVRPRRPILLNAFTLLSLVLLCVILGLAAWTSCVGDRSFQFGFNGSLWRLVVDGDGLGIDNEPQRQLEEVPLAWLRRQMRTVSGPNMPSDQVEFQRRLTRWNAANNLLTRLSRKPALRPMGWGVSYVLLFAVIAMLPAARVVSLLVRTRRRARLRARRLCVYCKYDIRESERVCPECGKPLPALHRTTSEVAEKLSQLRF